MGTMLYARGIFLNRCFDELNLTQPDLVAEVHTEYVRAGADVIETNTFGANRFKLVNFGLADKTRAINLQGARIAKHAAREAAWVAGSIGPLGVRIEPWGRTGTTKPRRVPRAGGGLAEGGVDLFILETFRDLNEIKAAIRAVRAVSDKPIVAQMTTGDDSNSLDGTPPQTFTPELERAGADVIGVNCSVGPAAMLETIETMSRLTGARLSAQPNAGRPRDVDGRNLYLSSPDYIASYARRFIAAGVRLVAAVAARRPITCARSRWRFGRWRPPRRARGHRRRVRRRGARARDRRSPREVEDRPRVCRSGVRDRRRGVGAARPRSCERRAPRPAVPGSGRAGYQCPGLSEVRRPRERAGAGRTDRAASQSADIAALLVPRSQPDRDAVGSSRRA
jgi:methionine synthase I (cobalamin-dependent)